jgi:hypothetical protein
MAHLPPTFRRNSRLPKAAVLHRAVLAPGEVMQLRGLTVSVVRCGHCAMLPPQTRTPLTIFDGRPWRLGGAA